MGEAFREHMKMARKAYSVLNRLRVRGGKLIRGAKGYWVIETGASTSTSNYAGGITATDNDALTVTINADEVVFGIGHAHSASTVVAVGGTSGSKHYVFAYGTINPLTITISPTTTSTFPVHAVNTWRRALYEVYVDAGAIVVNRIMYLGVIDLTSFYGA